MTRIRSISSGSRPVSRATSVTGTFPSAWENSSSAKPKARPSALAGADANRLLHRQHEDLAVADLARAGVPEDGLDDDGLVFVLDHDLQLDLRPDIDGEGRAAVALDGAFLATRALGLEDRQGREPPVEQLGPDRLERLVADESLYLLHCDPPYGRGGKPGMD